MTNFELWQIVLRCPKCFKQGNKVGKYVNNSMYFNEESPDYSVGIYGWAGWSCEICDFTIDLNGIDYKCKKCGEIYDGEFCPNCDKFDSYEEFLGIPQGDENDNQ